MTAREAYEAKKASRQGRQPVRTADPALRELIDLATQSINGGRPAFAEILAKASKIVEPK